MRAAHQILDNPKVFDDPIALKIVGVQGDSEIQLEKGKFKTRIHSYIRAGVVARSRFVEDELSAAIETRGPPVRYSWRRSRYFCLSQFAFF